MRPVQVKELLIIGTIAKRMGSMDGGHGCHACHYVGGVTFGGSLLMQMLIILISQSHNTYE